MHIAFVFQSTGMMVLGCCNMMLLFFMLFVLAKDYNTTVYGHCTQFVSKKDH